MARPFKRPFQPSITSYFACRPDTDTAPPLPSTSTSSPSYLPPTIQSSLLNVGMRVRKSVPEGYKTKPPISPAPYPPLEPPPTSTQLPPTNTTTATYPGLIPYCGILKTGNYAPQCHSTTDLPPLQFPPPAEAFGTEDLELQQQQQVEEEEDEDEDSSWPLFFPPPSSQDSISSADTVPTPGYHGHLQKNNKRRRQGVDDEDLGLESQPVSPRSRPVSHTRMPNLDFVRPILAPMSRTGRMSTRRFGGGESEMLDVDVDVDVDVCLVDFGEAGFLR